MRELIFDVEVRDKDLKRYKDSEGLTVIDFSFREKFNELAVEKTFETHCKSLYRRFKAISPESKVNVEVREFNGLTGTYPCLYSFYGGENKFVKHN